MKGLFVSGTDTDVGKTWVGTRLIQALSARGLTVSPRKPIESGWPELAEDLPSTDTWKLAAAAGLAEQLDTICPNRFPAPLSPVRAARMVDRSLTLDDITKQCMTDISSDDFIYVEGAGGFYSPLVEDGLNADLASQLNLPIVLIANNKLGCISQVLLCCEAMEKRNLDLRAIILNQVTPVTESTAMNNQEDIAEYVTQPVFSLHHAQDNLPAPLIDLLY